MQRDRLCYPVHRQVAGDVAFLRTGLFHVSALEGDLRKFLDIKKFPTAQMIVALNNSGVDAANINSGRYRRVFRVLPVDVDLAVELLELAVSGAKKLVN